MTDPQVLYAVTAVVVVGLAAWVFMVLTRAPKLDAAGEIGPGDDVSLPPPPRGDDGAAPREDATLDVQVETEDVDEPTGERALILVTAVGRTDPGLKRANNEDAYVVLEDRHLFVIADGMGRHAAGEVASRLAVESIAEAFRDPTVARPRGATSLSRRAEQLEGAIHLANQRIFAEATGNAERAGMGTTVVAAYFSPNKQRVYIAHVGDSRCYRVRDGRLRQLTQDHTLAAAGASANANVLSRAVGVEPQVSVDLSMESPLPGDAYLLCSDGLTRMAEEADILRIITGVSDPDAATRQLIDLANARGGRDNITAILIRVDAPRG